LLSRLGAKIVGVRFVIELGFLGGRERLGDFDVRSLITY
jgi:adenine/guanine phosphoribosyltransferase-like PRPP-binding protein